ncbi:hypothetical protein TNCT_94271 [Trichonephila clavata]|uniref:Uncharacterized protein n=1 Tax=Trichonephila clavata TaxID=2740835 RepID=A0A8X6FJ00_TRICU|nr:hypothetical protein TNCT_94271 [Trichonephila clavata]
MKKEQDSRQIRSATVLREQLKLQSQQIRQNASRVSETPEQKGNHVSMKIRSATELPEQLKYLNKGNHVSWKFRSATELQSS